jgi:hypothetical protein
LIRECRERVFATEPGPIQLDNKGLTECFYQYSSDLQKCENKPTEPADICTRLKNGIDTKLKLIAANCRVPEGGTAIPIEGGTLSVEQCENLRQNLMTTIHTHARYCGLQPQQPTNQQGVQEDSGSLGEPVRGAVMP